jgi:hypothetical protein
MPNPPPDNGHSTEQLVHWITDAVWITVQKIDAVEGCVEKIHADGCSHYGGIKKRLDKSRKWFVLLAGAVLILATAGGAAGSKLVPLLLKGLGVPVP